MACGRGRRIRVRDFLRAQELDVHVFRGKLGRLRVEVFVIFVMLCQFPENETHFVKIVVTSLVTQVK